MKPIMTQKGLNLEDVLSSTEKKRAFRFRPVSSDPDTVEESVDASLRTVQQGLLVDRLDSTRVYSLETIREVCIDYRLRFLDLSYFRGAIPEEATEEIRRLEREHGTELTAFKIMAPSRLFKLEDKDDPMLFVPLGNDYFYLVHKWGSDLHPLRRWLVWPFKTLPNFMVLIFLISVLITLFTPMGALTPDFGTAEKLILFLFVFKSVIAVFIYFGFASGKNFNTVIWNSRYYNA